MELDQLENKLEEAIDGYRYHVVKIVNEYHTWKKADQDYMLSEVLDEMNRHAFYTFVEFKHNIMEYLKN